MTKPALMVFGLLVTAGVVMTMAIERQTASQLRAQAVALMEQTAQITQTAADNARLTNLVARATTAQSLSREQLLELLRLRNEVGQLRILAGQQGQLEATNAGLRKMALQTQETLARARALPNYWPKDQLAFAGYADPPSALRSLLTSLKNGDLNAMLDCFPPDIVAKMEDSMKRDLGDDPAARPAAFKAMVDGFMAGADGFHIVDQAMTDSNEVTINLSIDGEGPEGRAQKMIFRRTGNDWKFAGGD